MTAEMDETELSSAAADVAELPATALRAALEFAVGIAAAGQKIRPPLVYPAGLKPFLKFQRLDQTSLPQVRRTVVADDDFRTRIGMVATTELVDDVGMAWLQRTEGWELRVLELHNAARKQAADALAETALRKAERRRDAAEQVAMRAQAELLSNRDDIAREQARREKAESKAALSARESDSLRSEVAQLQRELQKLRTKLAAETERAEQATNGARAAADQIRELEVLRDTVLAQRAAEVGSPPAEPERLGSPSPEAVHALEQAAAATHDLSKSLARAAKALSRNDDVSPNDRAVSEPSTKQRPAKRKPIPIPGGVYGDTVAAAAHLLRTPNVCVIVDGYNVAKLAWPQLDLVHQREMCIGLLEDLARRFGTDLRVVFDGADVVGASAGRRLIRVQYSPAGVIADDVIRAEVAALPARTPVVVATNDQAIASDVRTAGANVLSSDTLLAIGGRTVRS